MKKGKRSSRECKSCQLVFVALFFARAAQKKNQAKKECAPQPQAARHLPQKFGLLHATHP